MKTLLRLIIFLLITNIVKANSSFNDIEINVCFINVEQSVLDSLAASGGINDNVANGNWLQANILTSPFETTNILTAIKQNPNTDIILSPTIRTMSGSNAIFKVVTEYLYPTDFNVQSVAITNDNHVSFSAVLVPSNFEKRDVGTTINITPFFDSQKNIIKLDLMAEVVSEPIWKEYNVGCKSSDDKNKTLTITQPFFYTRSINQNITLYNNSTVILGGMVTTNKKDIKKKIPVLGYIPLLGRIFQHKKEITEKWNLIISVNAKTVNK